jgi:hypothetical protein
MLRKALISVAGGLILMLAWTSPALAASTAGPVVRTVHLSLRGTAPALRQLQSRNAVTGQAVSPFASPPGGGCTPTIAGQITGNYINGTLSTVLATYQTQVVCTATGPGQSMGALVTTAGLWKELNNIQEGPTVNCVNCLVSPVSENIYTCAGLVCAGGYWVTNVSYLGAPAGWDWPSAPSGCIGVGPSAPYSAIQCTAISNVVTVSPTG